MSIKLVKASYAYQDIIVDMLKEWISYNHQHSEENKSPMSIFRNDYHDFDYYLDNLEVKEAKDGLVCDSTYFLYDDNRNKMLGAICIRHTLNDYLLNYGGHIGDGIRPSERNKGYGALMISLALEKCKSLEIDRVLMVCDKSNIASAKTIIKNNGILENEVIHENKIIQRYWIEI